jgi:hypothetical protein
MKVFSMLQYRSVLVGAIFASILWSTVHIQSDTNALSLRTMQASVFDSLPPMMVCAETSAGSILSPDVCPYVSTSAFDRIYEGSEWGAPVQKSSDFYSDAKWPPKERKSASGTGSDLGYPTQVSMQILKEVIQRYNVKTMIDLPCGDANWVFDSWETDSLELYIGLDIVKPVIEANVARLAHHSNKIFRHWDGSKCPLPKIGSTRKGGDGVDRVLDRSVDLVHSRDVLQHIPLDQGVRFLCNVFQSGARLFVTTTFPASDGRQNNDIKGGGFFNNDLTLEPFGMPSSALCVATHPTIELDQTCVYDLTQPWVADWIAKKNCDALLVKKS